jgi:hypothetical protein
VDARGQPLQALGKFERAGTAAPALSAPSGLTVRGDDQAYVADTGNHRILRLERREAPGARR